MRLEKNICFPALEYQIKEEIEKQNKYQNKHISQSQRRVKNKIVFLFNFSSIAHRLSWFFLQHNLANIIGFLAFQKQRKTFCYL